MIFLEIAPEFHTASPLPEPFRCYGKYGNGNMGKGSGEQSLWESIGEAQTSMLVATFIGRSIGLGLRLIR
jgi:hypothetical protein